MADTAARRKRINRLKKIILGSIVLAIIIPVMISVFLGYKVNLLSRNIEELEIRLSEAQSAESQKDVGVFATAYVEESPREVAPEEVVKAEPAPVTDQTEGKRVYLTFDDGPSSNTAEILDILKAYDVKATFFVIGKTDEASKALYQRIVEEGHTLGMHSYSHKYEEIYASEEAFAADLQNLQEYLYEVTGVWPRYYRFPGGSSNKVSKADMHRLIAFLDEKDITYFDWNIASGDAVSGYISKDAIVKNCTRSIGTYNDSMILLHDAAEKDTTVEALPEIIAAIRMKGDFTFFPISDETPKVQHVKGNNEISNIKNES